MLLADGVDVTSVYAEVAPVLVTWLIL